MPYDSAKPELDASRRRHTRVLIRCGYLPAQRAVTDGFGGLTPGVRAGFTTYPSVHGDGFFTTEMHWPWCPAWIHVLWEHPSTDQDDVETFKARVKSMQLRPDKQRAVLMEALMVTGMEKYEKLSVKNAVAILDQQEK